jgi:hypothetical protein
LIESGEEILLHEVVCPHCRKAFKFDEAGYADIVSQARNQGFKVALAERLVQGDAIKKERSSG